MNGLPPFFIRNGTGGNEWLPVQHPQPGQAIPYEILLLRDAAAPQPAGRLLRQRQQRPGRHHPGQRPAEPGAARRRHLLPQQRLRRHPRRAHHRPPPGRAGRRRQGVVRHAAHPGRHGPGRRPVLRPPPGAGAGPGAWTRPDPARLARDPAVAQAVGRLALWNRRTPTGIAEGYDAADSDGQRQPRPAWSRPTARPPPSTRSGAARSSRAPSTPGWPPSGCRCPTASGP